MKIKYFIIFIVINSSCFSQNRGCGSFKNDSCIIPPILLKQEVKLLEAMIKINCQVQFIQHQQKNYLKIIVKDNLGFGQTGSLLLMSNKKQFYLKTIKLEPIDKNSGYFLIDLNSNYIVTLKENGLTTIIFKEKAEFVIPKTDSEIIKKSAVCFFDLLQQKK